VTYLDLLTLNGTRGYNHGKSYTM